jgi:hypothetical protein
MDNSKKLFFKDEKEKDWLRHLLKDEIVTLTFTKKDGSERIMKCTLNEQHTPKIEKGIVVTSRKKSDEAQPVFDIEANGWRSFRWDSIEKIEFSLGSKWDETSLDVDSVK